MVTCLSVVSTDIFYRNSLRILRCLCLSMLSVLACLCRSVCLFVCMKRDEHTHCSQCNLARCMIRAFRGGNEDRMFVDVDAGNEIYKLGKITRILAKNNKLHQQHVDATSGKWMGFPPSYILFAFLPCSSVPASHKPLIVISITYLFNFFPFVSFRFFIFSAEPYFVDRHKIDVANISTI